MQAKHIGKIIGLLVLLFISTYVTAFEECIQQGMMCTFDAGYTLLLSLANLAITSFIMMLVPFICRLTNRGKLGYESGRRICKWNSIILFILASVALVVTGIIFVGGIGAVFYYFINKWLFVEDEESFMANETILLDAVQPAYPEKKTSWMAKLLAFSCVFIIGLAIAVVIHNINAANDFNNTTKPHSTVTRPDTMHAKEDATASQSNSEGDIEYDSYYVGIRTISFNDKFTAEFIYALWKANGATEAYMIELMNENGASQGGGQLYIIAPGEYVKEVDEWCFDRTRKVGDTALIETEYGYTLCYFSLVVPR